MYFNPIKAGWRLCVLSAFLGLGGNVTPVVAQQPFGSYLSGTNSKLSIAGVAADAAGNVYLAGATSSADLRTEHAAQAGYGGGTDAFIIKLDQAGNVLYASYLGGGAQDWVTGIAVDSENNAYLTGWTASTDFPTRFAAQPSLRGRRNGFVAKFSPEGALIYSTYLGGTGDDAAAAIAVDSEGSAYVTGAAASPDFPVVRAIQSRTGGGVDAFVTKLGAFGDIRYSTYIGGGALDRGQGIAVDAAGRAYIAGVTASYDFPFKNPFRGYSGGTDGFVARLSAEGDGLEYATWIGGSGNEEVSGVAVDSLDRAYVTGWTDSRDFPLVNPLQDSLRGGEDAFVIRLTPTGDGLSYSTYLGGSGTDRGLAIAADAAGRAHITGWTRSSDFPASGGGNALQKGWLAELNPAGTQLDSNAYVGSGEADEGRAVALAASGNVFVAGETSTPASQDGFLIRFSSPARTRLSPTEAHGASKLENPRSLSASGIISANTTWHLTDSPILVTDNVDVASGATLTIEAGVTVQFAAGKLLQVDGQLIARGTASSAITFISSQATQAPGQWGYLLFNSDCVGASFDVAGNYVAGSILEYVTISSAGGNVGGLSYAVWLAGGAPFINFAAIQQNLGPGIYISDPVTSLVKITNSSLNNNSGFGVLTNVGGSASAGGTVVLQSNAITNNAQGVNLTFSGVTTLIGNKISGNQGAGIRVNNSQGGTLTIANNTIAGNEIGIFVGTCCEALNITGNLVRGNTPSGGVTALATNGAVISGNVIVGNTNAAGAVIGEGAAGGYGGGLSLSAGATSLTENNIISANTAGISGGGVQLGLTGNSTVQHNAITGNTAPTRSGLDAEFSGTYTSNISQNTITQNQATAANGSAVGIKDVSGNLTFSQNNLHNNAAPYTLENLAANTTPMLNVPNNWWGTTSTATIRSLIYDFAVDGSRGVVSYAPALGAINTTAPVSPPTNVVVAAATDSVSLSWAANPEPNIAGYKVYYGAQPGPPYLGRGATQGPSPVDVGNVTSFALSNLPAGAQYLAVTAYNTSYTGATADQTNGFESAFANFATLQSVTFGALSDVTFGAVPITIGATASSGLAVAFASTTPLVCTVSGSTVTIAGAGTCSITASQAGNSTFAAAVNVVQSFTVMRAQTIAFSALPAQIFGSPPFALNASASSGLPVAFASSSTGICTVSGATATLVAAGTCSITASQPGDGVTWGPAAPVTVTFTIDTSFGDVSTANETQAFITAIDDMLSKGITSGCQASPREYCPSQDVTRGQMAVFIISSIYRSSNFTYNPTPYFTDATPSSVGGFFPFIQKMRELGITSGCTPTTYCPNDNVTRGQMAVFIILARYGSLNFDYPATPYFTDATTASVGGFFKYIQRMKQDNITGGCTPTTYCPNQNVTRDQMAVFLMVGGFNLAAPTTPVLSSVSPATGGLGDTVNVTLTGLNTNFVQGKTTVTARAGITVGTVTVNSPTSLTVQVTIAANATPNPASLLVTTPVTAGIEEVVLPNGFTITSDPASGAIAYWNGNGTTANSISSLTGTLVNGATYASAISRTLGLPDAEAFSLNGTNAYVQAASGETATVSGARTLAAWVYPNPAPGLGMPILTGGSGTFDTFGITGASGTCSSAGPYQLYIDVAGTCYVSDNSLAPDVWSLVAVTFDGSKVVFYIDGVASVGVPAAQMSNYGLATLEIGGNTLGGTSSGASFNGLLSEIQVYNRALSPAEIQGLYTP